MIIPPELRYGQEHEWAKKDGGEIMVGITDYAQKKLGDVVFVELPAIGKEIKVSDAMAVIESFKAASEVYAPLSGIVLAVNSKLSTNPGLVNKDPYGEGWIVRLKPLDVGEWENLLTYSQYEKLIQGGN